MRQILLLFLSVFIFNTISGQSKDTLELRETIHDFNMAKSLVITLKTEGFEDILKTLNDNQKSEIGKLLDSINEKSFKLCSLIFTLNNISFPEKTEIVKNDLLAVLNSCIINYKAFETSDLKEALNNMSAKELELTIKLIKILKKQGRTLRDKLSDCYDALPSEKQKEIKYKIMNEEYKK